MESLQDFRHNIIKNLHKAVKLCQSEFVNKTEVATESNFTVSQLCIQWELIFFHGIKKKSSKSIFSLKYNNLSELPNSFIQQMKPFSNQYNYSFWSFICEFLESDDVIRFTDTLDKIDTEIGRCRAWLRSAINEQTLEPFFVKVVSKHGQNIARKYYDAHALILDDEENAILPNLAAGISSIMFALELNNEYFNNFPESNNRSQNNSTSSSVSRPVLFSSSTSGSFEDIEIIESIGKTANDDSRNNSRKKNRIINIVPIDDDDDGVSDSSDLYSPFSLLKTSVLNTGLNLVSKFQFGNDDKLSNILEHENQTIPSDSINNSLSENNPPLINGCFHEFDETEFEDCCLSLQKEFYSPSTSHLTNNHIDKLSDSVSQTFLSVDLVAVEPISNNSMNCKVICDDSNIISSISPAISTLGANKENSIDNQIWENQEIKRLKHQTAAQSMENERLKNEINLITKDFESREHQYKTDLYKLSRENEILKKKLKSYIAVNESIEIDSSLSEEFTENSQKIEQLLQMHADILELNYQLQKSLVDKDIKIGMLQSKVSVMMDHEESSGIHFDRFGTIYIGIIDYFQRGEGSNKHYCYKIHIRCCPLSSQSSPIGNDEWTTCRRYKEFHRFYLEFISKNPSVKNIVFPSKWLYKNTEEQRFERQKGLESFLHTAVAYIFQNALNMDNNESQPKPVTYESFKRGGRWGWGSIESGSSATSINNSDEFEIDRSISARNKIISIISFLAPNSDDS